MNIVFGMISFMASVEHRAQIIKDFIGSHVKKSATVHQQSSLVHHLVKINTGNHQDSLLVCEETTGEKGSSFILKTDDFGFEPLYYVWDKNSLYFSSAQRYLIPFLNHLALNDSVLCELFTLGFIAPPDTLIKNIYSLPTTKILHFDGKLTLLERRSDCPDITMQMDKHHIHDHLVSALQTVLPMKDIGILCSGGLDSTLLASILKNDLDKSSSLFTVLSNVSGREFENTAYIKHRLHTKNFYFRPQSTHFWRAVYHTIFLGESEMVGILSFNAAVEYLFAEYVAEHGMEVVLTGDDNWITPRGIHSQTPGYYALKYGILGGQLLHALLRNHTSSYLYYCHKYAHLMVEPIDFSALKNNRWEVHASLIGKINGKIRMKVGHSPPYYFPFLDKSYLDYISTLNLQNSAFNYREALTGLIKKQKTLKMAHMDRVKTWMPSFFDGNDSEEIIRLSIEKIINKNSFVCELFEKSQIMYTIQRCGPLARMKLIMALLYLTVFHEIFIENKGKFSDEMF